MTRNGQLAFGAAPLVCLLVLMGADAVAHEYWLEANAPLASKGDELVLHLRMGQRLTAEEERPLQKDRISRFDLFGTGTVRRDLLATGADGQTPAAKVRLEGGAALVVMNRKPLTTTLEPATFNAYLAEEGLEAIAAQRTRLGQADAPGREVYVRFLKALIQEREPAAATANTLYKRRLDERLEILLENDPGQLRPDGRLTVKVLFEGKPLVGAKVFACRRAKVEGQEPVALAATTSAQGMAEFALDQPGLWLVRLVHMRATAAASGPKADANAPQWESFWAGYTFGARFAPTGMAPSPRPAATP